MLPPTADLDQEPGELARACNSLHGSELWTTGLGPGEYKVSAYLNDKLGADATFQGSLKTCPVTKGESDVRHQHSRRCSDG
jgi:hypothetical protein